MNATTCSEPRVFIDAWRTKSLGKILNDRIVIEASEDELRMQIRNGFTPALKIEARLLLEIMLLRRRLP